MDVAVEQQRMDLDQNGLEVLGRDECLELLGSAALGRIGVSSAALPLVLPVNFCVDGGRIVVRTGASSTLEAATRNAVVSFEVDDIDPVFHAGWSVVVTGVARPITDELDLQRARRLPLAAWGGAGNHYVAITPDRVSGRRIRRPAPPRPPGVRWR
jgi:nitroimidazol reductase NimA-like FMN-containing flavoprotein (pyridoxamine 5'-phosphate oxidase superfamily)